MKKLNIKNPFKKNFVSLKYLTLNALIINSPEVKV